MPNQNKQFGMFQNPFPQQNQQQQGFGMFQSPWQQQPQIGNPYAGGNPNFNEGAGQPPIAGPGYRIGITDPGWNDPSARDQWNPAPDQNGFPLTPENINRQMNQPQQPHRSWDFSNQQSPGGIPWGDRAPKIPWGRGG